MGQDSKIEWTHHTFNPWRGCTKVSPGCKFCYAETLSRRNPKILGTWGRHGSRPTAAASSWQQPLKWNRDAERAQERRRVFCASLADVFEGEDTMPKDAWLPVQEARGRLWDLIEETPWLDWLLLTKRPQNIQGLATRWHAGWPPNVWIGTSVENQEQADTRIPELLKVPAAVRFLSCEPLLGPVDLTHIRYHGVLKDVIPGEDLPFDVRLDALRGRYTDGWEVGGLSAVAWVIAGGESGAGARPMHPDWVRSLRDQCQAAGVAFHFKQWGEYMPHPNPVPPQRPDDPKHRTNTGAGCFMWPDGHFGTQGDWWRGQASAMDRVGKKKAGRELDGRTWDEVPT